MSGDPEESEFDGDFEGKKPLPGIRDTRNPDRESCGPQVELVEDRCQTSIRVEIEEISSS
jgi:hypothetical protein